MAQTNVMTEADSEPDVAPARLTRRRVLRGVLVLVLGILAVLAIWQDPLYAGRL